MASHFCRQRTKQRELRGFKRLISHCENKHRKMKERLRNRKMETSGPWLAGSTEEGVLCRDSLYSKQCCCSYFASSTSIKGEPGIFMYQTGPG